MRDLTNPALIYLKAVLFLLLGMASAAVLVLRQPAFSTVVLIALAVWSFSRVYYFAFYVLERYVDPSFRFSGLISVAKYLLGKARDRITAKH